MIHSEDGIIKVQGSALDVMADFGCIVATLIKLMHRTGWTDEEIKDEIAKVVSKAYVHAINDEQKEGE